MSRRTERIGEQIRAELARLLHEEITDPRIGLVTLTQVDVSPDLSNARVYWSAMKSEDSDDRATSEAGLESASGFLRHRLAQSLDLKRVPEIRFRYDSSLAQGEATLSLLRQIRDGAQK
jgi:ribosome-binding factor A